MKKCPYCAEEIQDDAIKCRYCGSMLTGVASGTDPGGTASPSTTQGGAAPSSDVTFDYTGQRFVLGHGSDYYGIWSRESPGAPVQRFPRTDAGWRDVWQLYASWEPGAQPVGATAQTTYQPASRTNGMAIAALVLGIVWIYGIGSVLAVIFGFIARRDIDRSGGSQTGRGMATAGIVLGFIGIAGLVALIVGFAIAAHNGSPLFPGR